METKTFTSRLWLDAPAEHVFDWHARPGAFERLSPGWENVQVLRRTGGIEKGARLELKIKLGPLWKRWVAEHTAYEPGRLFRDVQREGPFLLWEHTHSFEPDGKGSWLVDSVKYALPLGPLGRLLSAPASAKIHRLFRYRHDVTLHDVTAHSRHRGLKPMNVLVTGSTGLVGSTLVPFLTTGGHHVTRLLRKPAAESPGPGIADALWNPESGQIDKAAFEGVDAVVHLAGENIAAARWTPRQKARIRESRVRGTGLIAETLAGLANPPRTFLSTSAIGWYGNRGSEVLNESAAPGTGFLPEVCRDWEAAVEPAERKGLRVVRLRVGVVLTPRGGALAKMLTPFKLGVGGIIGEGSQYVSWITLDDLVGAIHHILLTDSLRGPVNGVAPHPVTNRELTRTLGRVLSRPTLFPMPGFAARLLFGEMADELLLASTRVTPDRLLASGYKFRHPELEGGLRHVLGK